MRGFIGGSAAFNSVCGSFPLNGAAVVLLLIKYRLVCFSQDRPDRTSVKKAFSKLPDFPGSKSPEQKSASHASVDLRDHPWRAGNLDLLLHFALCKIRHNQSQSEIVDQFRTQSADQLLLITVAICIHYNNTPLLSNPIVHCFIYSRCIYLVCQHVMKLSSSRIGIN